MAVGRIESRRRATGVRLYRNQVPIENRTDAGAGCRVRPVAIRSSSVMRRTFLQRISLFRFFSQRFQTVREPLQCLLQLLDLGVLVAHDTVQLIELMLEV